jgi:hypothetical protein
MTSSWARLASALVLFDEVFDASNKLPNARQLIRTGLVVVEYPPEASGLQICWAIA